MSIITREMAKQQHQQQNKPELEIASHILRWLLSKYQEIRVGKDVEKMEPSCW